MRPTRFDEVWIGDIIKPRKGSHEYRVTGFRYRDGSQEIDVTLQPVAIVGETITRPMRTLVKNWRMVHWK